MPALDYINKTEEKTFDVSAAATYSTNAIENGRAGFNLDEGFTAVITEASAANFSDRAFNIYLEVSLDNGSNYYPIGVAPMNIGATGVPKQMQWAACRKDIIPENYTGVHPVASSSRDHLGAQHDRRLQLPGLPGQHRHRPDARYPRYWYRVDHLFFKWKGGGQ